MSRNELLPKLDFIVKTYVAGLEAQNQIPQAVGNQFSQGGPGYTVGFEFEVPLGNRAAKARVEQRQWELQRSINVFRATVETSLTDV
ncbi:MAG: TolC family protein, partial [Phycisphaerae bacterium]